MGGLLYAGAEEVTGIRVLVQMCRRIVKVVPTLSVVVVVIVIVVVSVVIAANVDLLVVAV